MSDDPATAAYLDALAHNLKDLAPDERHAILDDIRSHFAEAAAGGQPIASVIAAMAPPRDMARAYAVELALKPQPDEALPAPLNPGALKLALAVAIGSAPALALMVLMAGVGLMLMFAGGIATVASLLVLAGVPLDLTAWEFPSPILALVAGAVMTAAGVAVMWALNRYVRFAALVIMKVIPGSLERNLRP